MYSTQYISPYSSIQTLYIYIYPDVELLDITVGGLKNETYDIGKEKSFHDTGSEEHIY